MIVTSGVVPNAVLVGTTGTVLVPLAAAAGTAVTVSGSLLVSLALGLASIQVSLAQYYSIQERLPAAGAASFLGKLSERGRFWLAIAPMFLIFVLAELVTWTGYGSFGRMLGFLGAFALPLLSGIFPILLLASTRRKGDFVPGYVIRLLGNKVLLSVTYLIFLGSIFVFGLFIWETAVERSITLVTGIAILIVTMQMLRRGAMDRRLVIQVVDDQTLDGRSSFSVVDAGESATTDITLTYPGHQQSIRAASAWSCWFHALRRLDFQLTPTSTVQVKLWSYQLTPAGAVVPLPTRFTLYDATQEMVQSGELSDANGNATVLGKSAGCKYFILLNFLQ